MPSKRSIRQLLEAWQAAKANLPATVATILSEHERELLDLNRQQLYSGYDGYGRRLKMYADAQYDHGYADYKHDLNPLPGFGVPDLRLTGSTYEKMRTLINSRTVDIDSTDPKAADLKSKYGEAIFKLNADSINILRRQVIQPNLVYEIARQTGSEIG